MTTLTHKLFEPDNAQELMRGWLLHAHKCRDRHDAAARLYQTYRYRLGIPTIIFSTIAGASAFASISTSLGTEGKILFGTVGIAGAVLAALQTFFDFPGQAERHRITG